MEVLNLNIELENKDDMEVVVYELLTKEEFVCTGDACGLHACGFYSI